MLRTSVARMVIDFANFTAEDRMELISQFRDFIPLHKQQNWQSIRHRESTPAERAKRERELRIGFAMFFFVLAVLCANVAVARSRPEFWFGAAFHLAAAACILFWPTSAKRI